MLDAFGKQVLTQNFNDTKSVVLNTGQLAAGIYHIQIDADTIYTMDEHVAIGANSANARLYVYTDGSSTNSSIEAVAEAPGFNRAIIGRVYSKDANTVNQFGVVGIAQVAPGESTGGSNWHYGVDGESYINNTASTNVGLNGNADGLGVNNYGVRGNSGDSANVRNYG